MQGLELKLAQFKTGDLVLFAGSGRCRSLIKRFTRSKWSHIGMVLHLDAYPYPLLFESTGASRGCRYRAWGNRWRGSDRTSQATY